MADLEKRTISISSQQASYIDAKVASGDYASASEVMREGLRNLQKRDAKMERWLREEAVPAYDAITANPEIGIPMEKVFAKIDALHAERVRKSKKKRK